MAFSSILSPPILSHPTGKVNARSVAGRVPARGSVAGRAMDRARALASPATDPRAGTRLLKFLLTQRRKGVLYFFCSPEISGK